MMRSAGRQKVPDCHVVAHGTHPRWDTPNRITKRINELIASAKAADGDTREAIVENAYSWIR